jgi:hypothetical protein
MHISETVATLEVAKDFIEGLGGSGLHDRFIPGPTAVEVTHSKGQPHIRLDYHISSLPDADAAAVVTALSALDAVHWSFGTVPYGTTEVDGVLITIEIYVPSPPREPRLREALINAGWSTVAGVG